MKTYKIPCVWEMYGYVEVSAESLEDAIEIAEDFPHLLNGEYIQGSFQVDYDALDDGDEELVETF